MTDPQPTKSSLWVPIPLAADLFIGFLYAATAQAITFRFIDHHSPPSIRGTIVILVVLLFLGSDWMSHHRVREQFGREFSEAWNYLKFVLEIAILATLLIALSGYTDKIALRQAMLPADDLPFYPAAAFGTFAVLSGIWNYLLLKQLSLPPLELFLRSILGTLDDYKALRSYFHTLYNNVKYTEDVIREELIKSPRITLVGLFTAQRQTVRCRLGAAFKRGILMILGQTLAIHVLFANTVGGFIILGSIYLAEGSPLFRFISQAAPVRTAIVMGILLFASFFFFAWGTFGSEKIRDILGCATMWVFVTFLYLGLRADTLVALIANQLPPPEGAV